MSQHCFNEMVGLMKDTCPIENRIPSNYHQFLRKLQELGMDVQEIDCCLHGCMLYYGRDANLDACKFCGHEGRLPQNSSQRRCKEVSYPKMHYLPLTPRLQRVYATSRTTNHMRWPYEHHQESWVSSDIYQMVKLRSIWTKSILILQQSLGM